MSSEHEYRYRVARRQALFDERVSNKTREHLDRYRDILNDVRNQDLIQYVSSEFRSLESELNSMYSLLSSAPGNARDMSMRLGNRFHALPRMARSMQKVMWQAEQSAAQAQHAAQRDKEHATARAEKEAFAAEREVERAKTESRQRESTLLEQVWQDELMAWDDVLARQLAFNELASIRRNFMVADNTASSDKLREALQSLRKQYELKTSEIRATEALDAQRAVQQETLNSCKQQIEQSGLSGNHTFDDSLSQASNLSPDEMSDALVKLTQELDNTVVDEACRREVVRATYQALQEAGFVVDNPRLVQEHGLDEVVVYGRKPAGAEAMFRIELNGNLQYKFERYRGSACKKDIDVVLPLLQTVYGIDLSNERVIWENPDDEDHDARPRPTNTMEK